MSSRKFEVFASSDAGGREGPFVFEAASAEAACDMYRAWAWGQINPETPTPTQTGGPLPNVTAKPI